MINRYIFDNKSKYAKFLFICFVVIFTPSIANSKNHINEHHVSSDKMIVTQNKKSVVSINTKKIKSSVRANLNKRKPIIEAVNIVSKPTFGELAGLHLSDDKLKLKSGVALIIDQNTNEVLFQKNEKAILPIASLTKLMTGLVLSEANLPLNEKITVLQEDVDTEKHSSSRLNVGSTLSRGELMHIALMSSENRAAHSLARTYPGGLSLFISLMNAKAKALGMNGTHYVDPTGLSSNNQSNAQDLAVLVNTAHSYPLLRKLTTSPSHEVHTGIKKIQYKNTNQLIKNKFWDIGLQKTGYISEAGQCLVMQANIAKRNLIMVFLDSTGKNSRIEDAQRVRQWIEETEISQKVVAIR